MKGISINRIMVPSYQQDVPDKVASETKAAYYFKSEDVEMMEVMEQDNNTERTMQLYIKGGWVTLKYCGHIESVIEKLLL